MTMLSNLAPIPELFVSYDSAQKLKVEAGNLTSHDLSARQICDLELLMNGGFNPLKGFLSEADYNGVVNNMRLTTGELWPMPMALYKLLTNRGRMLHRWRICRGQDRVCVDSRLDSERSYPTRYDLC